ncbi:sensor histidine kinase [Rhizobium sp. GCM10022189]|uniref:sensor histidine kinase n=1 Tax=Rhizobium sp. GCM10022189 TaxID=3252654 RepID=UPI00361AD9E9
MEDQPLLVSTLPPSRAHKRLALVIVMLMVAVYIGTAPLLHLRLSGLPIFVPLLDVALFIIDLATAALLYAHVSILGSRSLLALASGYMFTALIIVPHALTFPGAFSPTGLLGAEIQTSNYLQIFWRAGLPSAAIAYALLKNREARGQLADRKTPGRIFASIGIVALIVCSLTWLTTGGVALLPDIMIDAEHRRWAVDAPVIIPIEIAALVLVWKRRESVLDLWLLVVLCAWLIASLLVSSTTYRFSFVWYESRFYGLLASSFVLLGLLTEMTTLYGRLAVSLLTRRHERETRLMQVDATLAVVSHEINQPLAAIAMNGSAGLHELAKEKPDQDVLSEILKDIARDGHRAGGIIDGIRGMFNRDGQAMEELDLNQLVNDTLVFVSRDLHERGIAIELLLHPQPAILRGNRTQLQQVLLNLMSNAMEAIESSPGRLRQLRIVTGRSGNDIMLKVEDSGPGIDPDVSDMIFEPFVTTKAKGTGLGLSICRTIVERHGGRIQAMRNDYGGATVLTSVPASPGKGRSAS